MKHMRQSITIYFCILFVLGSVWGCQDHDSEQPEYGQSTFIPVSELTSNEELQNVLMDHGIHLFHSEVIAYQGQLIISSRGGKLVSVSMDGEVNWSRERPGNGPGEFEDPHDMQIADVS